MKELQLEDDQSYKPKVMHGFAFKHIKKMNGEDVGPTKK
jgi:hypothetical protein